MILPSLYSSYIFICMIICWSSVFTGANEKPKDVTFQTFPKSVTVQEKESVEIECEILGKPKNGECHYLSFYLFV